MGTVDDTTDEQSCLPPDPRLHVVAASWTTLSEPAHAVWLAERRRAARARGPARRFELEALVVGRSTAWQVGDVLIQLVEQEAGPVLVHAPAVVLTAPAPVPGERRTLLQLARRPVGLRPVPIGMATASLRAAQVRSASPLAEGPVTAPDVRRVLLGLWALEP